MEPAMLIQFAKFAGALLFVLALMGGLALVMRRFSGSAPVTLPHRRRLKVVESLVLDSRRRAVLLRRDDREHLVILGAGAEVVVESGIESKQDAQVIPLKSAAAE